MSEDTQGFNRDFGKSWIYPINLPVRSYQKEIVEEALYKNTMVCLPTGLGKTFIAAVVMYNFYRWYPQGKIIFMAPTRPLVRQQMDACYNTVAIPREDTTELTGHTDKLARDNIWKEKRIFFITPQVLQNDLDRILELGNEIKCLVFDEAHKARGNYAYCEVVRKLLPINRNFRVLALTATPASSIADVIIVCKSLLIAHLEIRNDQSADVVPHLFQKSFETVLIKLEGKMLEFRNQYLNIIDKQLRILVNNNVLQGNVESFHKGRFFYITKEYTEKNKYNSSSASYKINVRTLHICSLLYHGLEALTKHGLRTFLSFFEENINKPLLSPCSNDLRLLMSKVSDYLGPKPNLDLLPDGSMPDLPANSKFGHPKYYKLREILMNHFRDNSHESRVIVFSEYKESVLEIHAALSQCRDLVKSSVFMGQSRLGQKQQINVIESFKMGSCNTLISTSIGEEGIDIGAVDLVVCFDTPNKSSIRLIQRTGRTGRKSNGKVIMLVSEGREQQILKECLEQKDLMQNSLMRSHGIGCELYKENPRMVPEDIIPECLEMMIEIKPKQKTQTIMSMLDAINKSMLEEINSNILTTNRETRMDLMKNVDYDEFFPSVSSLLIEHCSKTSKTNENDKTRHNVRYKHQIKLQSSLGHINSSDDTKLLVSLTNHVSFLQNNISTEPIYTESKPKSKQTNIKDLFMKQTNRTVLTETVPSTKTNSVLELNKELSALFLTCKEVKTCKEEKHCLLCSKNQVSCKFRAKRKKDFLFNWKPPKCDLRLLLTKENIELELTKLNIFNMKNNSINNSNNNNNTPNVEFVAEFDDLDIIEPFELLHEDIHVSSILSQYSQNSQDENLSKSIENKDQSLHNQSSDISFGVQNNIPENIDQNSLQFNVNFKSNEDLLSFFMLDHINELFQHCDIYKSNNLDNDRIVCDRIVCDRIVCDNIEMEDDSKCVSPVIGNSQVIKEESLFESDEVICSSSEQESRSPILSAFSQRKTNFSQISQMVSEGMLEMITKQSTNNATLEKQLKRNESQSEHRSEKLKKSPKQLDEQYVREKQLNVHEQKTKHEQEQETKNAEVSPILNTSNTSNNRNNACNLSMSDLFGDSTLQMLNITGLPVTNSSMNNKLQQETTASSTKISQTRKFRLSTTKRSITLQDEDSDEDFLVTRRNFTQKTTVNKANTSKTLQTTEQNDKSRNIDDDFAKTPVLKKRKRSRLSSTNRNKRKKREKCDFIEDQAQVSIDQITSSDESSEYSQDAYDKSFVNDDIAVNDKTFMQKHYLESVKSPLAKSNKFKIPNVQKPFIPEEIYSQRVSPDRSQYLNDSFCVDEESSGDSEMSELELAEKLLNEKRKRCKKEREKSKGTSKWQRIKHRSDSE